MRKLGLFPKDTAIDFIKYRKVSFTLSVFFVIAFLAYMFFTGLNLGVDFKGGTVVKVQPNSTSASLDNGKNPLSALASNKQAIKDHILALTSLKPVVRDVDGGAIVQATISSNTTTKLKSTAGSAISVIRDAVKPYGHIIKTDFISPIVSKGLISTSIISVLLALLGIFVYVWVRFNSRYALIAIGSLIHDVILALGLLTICRYEVNISTIAAVLTIIGYSINDTIITFHQVKENSIRCADLDDKSLLNRSLNDVISRTVSTSLTVILVLVSVYLFGGSSLTSFSFTLLLGVIFGTYSSIYLCVPLLLYVKDFRGVSRKYRSK